jgi:4,5:9,10-diseco-3-hydroxy-5,9,17-trioxoandrosta-1(10),2-diene-4-oate hydrolase
MGTVVTRGALFAAALALIAALPGAAGEVASAFLDVDGVRIHRLDTAPGRTDLPLVILVHGWAGCTTDFRPLLERVGGERRWVAFDHPGCGESDKPDIHYSITGMAEFVEAVRAALGVETVDLVGHSLGGQIAVHYAVRHPDRVRRLVLIDPDGLAGEEGFWLRVVRLDRLVDRAFALNSRCVIRGVMRRRVFHGRTGLEAATDGKAAYLLTPDGNRAVARITKEAIGTEPVDDLLPLVAQPTLVVWGGEDRLLPVRWAGAWMRGLPRSELWIVPECGHMPTAEKPAWTAVMLEEFLRRP